MKKLAIAAIVFWLITILIKIPSFKQSEETSTPKNPDFTEQFFMKNREGSITQLREALRESWKVEHLDLRNCKNLDLKKYFTSFPNVITISISESKQRNIPNDIAKLNKLKKLVLTNSALQNLPYAIGDLKNLEYLDLSKNDLFHLPQSISSLKSLRYLQLNQNPRINYFNLVSYLQLLAN